MPRALLAVLAAALLCGACHGKGGPSDEDLLDKFVKDVSGPVDAALVERSIGYTQLADLPIDVRVPQLSGVYDSSKSDELLSSYRNGMRGHFYGTEIDVRSKTIAIHDAHADVKLALMTAVGPLHADIGLQKLASGWKVERVHIDR